MKNRLTATLFSGALFTGTLFTGALALGLTAANADAQTSKEIAPVGAARASTSSEALFAGALKTAAMRISPSVVTVKSMRLAGADSGEDALTPKTSSDTLPAMNIGSGLIVDPAGLIVTARRLVTQSTSIWVKLANGEYFPARLVAEDFRSELALLEVRVLGLTAARIKSTPEVLLGEWIVAVGRSGHVITKSSGTVRHKRTVGDGDAVLIASTAAKTPMKLGGPLVNLNGDVVGLVIEGTDKASRPQTLALPTAEVVDFLKRAKALSTRCECAATRSEGAGREQ